MHRPIVIRRYPAGLRLWVLGQRVHHGAVGCALIAASRRRPVLVALAAALIAHDRADWRAWFAREGVPVGISLDGEDGS